MYIVYIPIVYRTCKKSQLYISHAAPSEDNLYISIDDTFLYFSKSRCLKIQHQLKQQRRVAGPQPPTFRLPFKPDSFCLYLDEEGKKEGGVCNGRLGSADLSSEKRGTAELGLPVTVG